MKLALDQSLRRFFLLALFIFPLFAQDDSVLCTAEITPEAGPKAACGFNTFVTGELIYFTMREEGLDFAVNGWSPNSAGGDVEYPGVNFDAGFRTSLGVSSFHDGWEAAVEYAWLHSSEAKGSISSADLASSGIHPTWFDGEASPALTPSGPALSFAEGNWWLHYNTLDLTLGRNFFISRYLSLKPHIGLKGSWQKQNYSVHYQRNESSTSILDWMIRSRQKFWGVGLRAGFDAGWCFTRHWGFYSSAVLAALWSEYDVTRQDSESDAALADPIESVLLNTRNRFHALTPFLQLSAGLKWNTAIRDGRYHFLIQAGWEEQVWGSYNQLYRTYEEVAHGDLILQGLTVKVRFDF